MNTSPSRTLSWLLAVALPTAASGCDLQKLGSQATARSVAVATLLATPAFEVKAGAVVGLDGGPSGLDAGTLGLADAGVTVPSQTLATVFFGQRQGDALDVAPTGVAGATVRLVEVDGGAWPLADQGGGNYLLVGEDAGFAYRSNATYDFEIVQAGKTYVAEVERVPAQETVPEFHPPTGVVELSVGQSFTFTRPPPPAGEERHLGFVNVFTVGNDGKQGLPTFSNVPTTPLDFLLLVVTPGPWRSESVTVPATAFPAPDTHYLVVLQAGKLGGPKSDNLFSGSAIIAGTAEIAVVKTRP